MATEKQIAALAAARAAKANKHSQQVEKNMKKESTIDDSEIWFRGLLVAIQVKETKHVKDLPACVDFADNILATYKERFQ